jgi:hypothetical protein
MNSYMCQKIHKCNSLLSAVCKFMRDAGLPSGIGPPARCLRAAFFAKPPSMAGYPRTPSACPGRKKVSSPAL